MSSFGPADAAPADARPAVAATPRPAEPPAHDVAAEAASALDQLLASDGAPDGGVTDPSPGSSARVGRVA
jgi:hypothetical protein